MRALIAALGLANLAAPAPALAMAQITDSPTAIAAIERARALAGTDLEPPHFLRRADAGDAAKPTVPPK